MWLFTRDSYCSIVRHSDNPNQLLVRARQEDDIQRLWPDARIEATPDADYPFRAAIDEHDVVSAVGVALRAIRYTTDFKGGVTEPARHEAYFRVWRAMRDFGLVRRAGKA